MAQNLTNLCQIFVSKPEPKPDTENPKINKALVKSTVRRCSIKTCHEIPAFIVGLIITTIKENNVP